MVATYLYKLPDQVRGYGPVKTGSISEYRQRRAGLLQRFHNPASLLAVQEEGAAATTRPIFLRSSGNNR